LSGYNQDITMGKSAEMDPAKQTIQALDTAAKVASSPLVSILIDRATGYKLSKWSAEGEVKKREILSAYEAAKQAGVSGIQEGLGLRQTANLINVAAKSAKYTNDTSKSIAIDNDFFWNAVDYAQHVSDEEVQEVLAKILAGEYNEPGKYSLSTLQVLRGLGRKELISFQKVAALLLDASMIPENVYADPHEFLEGASFSDFQMLQSLGLILPNIMTKSITNPAGTIYIGYQDMALLFQIEGEKPDSIRIPGWYGLSQAGAQIVEGLSVDFNQDYYEWVTNNYVLPGYKIVKPVVAQTDK